MFLVTEMKSEPKRIEATPSMRNRSAARGDFLASFLVMNSSVPSWPSTGLPGLNFIDSAFGVASAWMNIERRACDAALKQLERICEGRAI